MVRRAHRAWLMALLVLPLVSLLLVSPPSGALTYSFKVTAENVDVHIKKDGSIDIDYTINFTNYAQLDGVDIGLPNDYYDLNSARASVLIGGASYSPSNVQKSSFVSTGVAVEFGSDIRNRIENNYAGEPFTLLFHINNPHMVYLNEIKEGTVGVRFRPTWFDSSSQQGATELLAVRLFFPPGFTNVSQAVWLQDRPWDSIGLELSSGLVMASWTRTGASPSAISNGDYDIGGGFPTKYVDRYYKNDIWTQLGEFCLVAAPCAVPAVIVAVLVVFGITYARKKRARDYFEPQLSVAGAGPRRDLTAVESAVALERPIEMVATMILFGMERKGMVEVDYGRSPVYLRPTGKPGEYPYEAGYLAAIMADGSLNRNALRDVLIALVKATQEKLKGFDYDATKRYYERICQKAWEEVKAAGTPELFAAGLDQRNEWMMLEPRYPVLLPMVYIGMPGHYHNRSVATKSGAPGPSPQQMAQNYVSRLKSTSSNLVGSMKSLSSEVTHVTHPAPISTSGGGFGGGGGGGCACACACACAGGGR